MRFLLFEDNNLQETLMMAFPQETDTISQESTFKLLLSTLSLSNLQELNQILFDFNLNQQYFRKLYPRRRKTQSSPHIQILPMQDSTYKQIVEYYSHKEELLPQARTTIRIKYRIQDIVRTHQHRKGIWTILSKAKFRMNQHPNYYKTLKECKYPQYYSKVIDNDVRRTNQEKTEQGIQILGNVLKCLAKRNPYVGYCQGMNFVVNFLVMLQFQEEECFWIAVELFEEILPKNYYTNMQGIAIDLKLIEAFLKLQRPEIYQVMGHLNVSLSFFCLEWLVCLCATILPYNVLMLLWDLLFIEGSVILLKAVIVIIDELSPILFSCQDFNDFLLELEPFKKKLIFEESTFLMKLEAVYIDRNLLNFARRVYGCLMQGEPKESKRHNQINCDPKWPICHQQLQKNKIQQLDPEPWVLKEEGPPKIITNYLELIKKNQKISKEDNREDIKKLLIGRMPHCCEPQAYDLLRGTRVEIQLNDYDSLTNSYLPAGMNETSKSFLVRASVIESTFIFHSPKSKP